MGILKSIFNLLRFNKKNWRAVALCVAAATVFWFFNALNKNYSANISFPLTFEYDDENYIPVKPLPHYVRLNVSGLGWDLFRRSLGLKVPPLSIPLESPAEVKKIVGASLPAFFSSQLDGLQINYVLTDTIHLQIDQRTTRNVMVMLSLSDRQLRSGYGLSSEIQVRPNKVSVEGPQSLVRDLPDTLAINLTAQNIDKPFSDEVEVEVESSLIVVSPPVVHVGFSVDRLIEIADTVPLRIINVPSEVRSVIQVTKVRCTYQVPASVVNSIPPESIVALIDLRGIGKGKHRIAPVLTGLPSFSQVVRVDTVDINL